MNGETNLSILISTMQPVLQEGQFVFCTIPEGMVETEQILMFFKETEGTTVICTKAFADSRGYSYTSVFAWITLQVHSSLEAVGLTAAFSNALAQHEISCNVIAGYYHDHIFVQEDKRAVAVAVLENLANNPLS